MKRLILCADNRSPYEGAKGYWTYMIHLSEAYAKVHGIDFKFVLLTKPIGDRHYSWARIPLLSSYVDTYDEIMWLDSDATIINREVDAFNYIKTAIESKTFIKDPSINPILYTLVNSHPGRSTACAGIFLLDCKDKNAAKALLSDWWNDIPDEKYRQEFPWDQSVWTEWSKDLKKQSRIRVADVYSFFDKDPAQVFIHIISEYGIMRNSISRMYYNRLKHSPQLKRVCIYINDTDIYTNLQYQYYIYLRLAIESTGRTVQFISDKNINHVHKDIKLYYVPFGDINLDNFSHFLFTSEFENSDIYKRVRQTCVKTVYIMPELLQKKASIPTDVEKRVDEVWVVETSDTTLSLRGLFHESLTIHSLPMLFEPIFKNTRIESKSYNSVKTTIIIMDRNEDFTRLGWKSLLIANSIYTNNKDKIEAVCLFNHRNDIEGMSEPMIRSLDIAKDNKLKLFPKTYVSDIICYASKNESDLVKHLFITSSVGNFDTQYLPLVFTGFPLLHSYKSLKEYNVGYFYNTNEDATDWFQRDFHKIDHAEYVKKVDKYLDRLLPYNNTQRINNIFEKLKPTLKITEVNENKTNITVMLICRSEARRKIQMEQVKALNIPFRVHYFTTDTLKDYSKDFDLKYPESFEDICNTRSHISAIQWYTEHSDTDYVLVCEDNVSFLKTEFVDKLNNLITVWKRHDDIDYIRIGYTPHGNKRRHMAKYQDSNLFWGCVDQNETIKGFRAYLIKRKSALEIVSLFNKRNAVDLRRAINEHIERPGVIDNPSIHSLQMDSVIPMYFNQGFVYPMMAVDMPFSELNTTRNELIASKYLDPREFYSTNSMKPIVISYDNNINHENTQYFIKTLIKNGWDSTMVGNGEIWRGFISKMSGYKQALELIEDERIVVLSDARDVICMRSPYAFIDGFKSFNRKLVVSMEMLCEGEFDVSDDYKGTQCVSLSKYWKHHNVLKLPIRKFVNSGLICGKAIDLRNYMNWVFENKFVDDQFALGNYMNKFPENVGADTEAILLHSTMFGIHAGMNDILKQSIDSPTFAEFFGRAAFFLHIPGHVIPGQKKLYDYVKQTLQLGFCDEIIRKPLNLPEPKWNQSYPSRPKSQFATSTPVSVAKAVATEKSGATSEVKSVKILVLRIFNHSEIYDVMYDTHRKFKDDSVYVIYNPNITDEYQYTKDKQLLEIKGEESYIPGILNKTIKAIEICLKLFDFDYIVRSNISTIINKENLKIILAKHQPFGYYGGAKLVYNWPKEYGNKTPIQYTQGTSIVISKDLCTLLDNNKHRIDYTLIDDVAIGKLFQEMNVPLNDIKIICPLIELRTIKDHEPIIKGKLKENIFFRCAIKKDSGDCDISNMNYMYELLLSMSKGDSSPFEPSQRI